jgi:PKD repeat protein
MHVPDDSQRARAARCGRMFISVLATTLTVLAGSAGAATTLPVLWTAGGLSAGTDSAGQAARITSDATGNVAVVSAPSSGRDLAVTSYTAAGALRWRSAVSPSIGTFVGDWVAAAPNGDVVAVGRNTDSRGNPIAITLVRHAGADGALRWRIDLSRTRPSVARLLVDTSGNSYLAFNSLGDGQDIQVHKYSPSGVLLWSRVIATGFFANDIATSLALGPDESDVVVTGDISGGARWITAAFNAVTGTPRWQMVAPEGTAALDVVVDAARVYVTGEGSAGTTGVLSVVAYDRATGARLWRTDRKPRDAGGAAGRRIALAPDGTLVATGQASRGFLDWYTVAMTPTGAVRWDAVRDGGLNTDEIPAAVVMRSDGTAVVTGRGGPNLPGGYIPGVTAGYGTDGALLWEGFSRMETTWATVLPNGSVCASGGYDALVTCFRVSGGLTAVMSVTPSTGAAPLTVRFDGSASTDADGTITAWAWSFGDGGSATGSVTSHIYTTPGTYAASLKVTDDRGTSSTATRSIVVGAASIAAPVNLVATAVSKSSIRLSWTNATAGATTNRVERCRGSSCTDFSEVAVVDGAATSFTDAGLAPSTAYRYRVRAQTTSGVSPYSNVAGARTPKR